jgi:hypothetical protein
MVRTPIRRLGLAVPLAAMAMWVVIGVASASAALPEYVPKSGTFPIGFTSTVGLSLLETVGGTKVNCNFGTNTGKLLNAKEDEVTITFEGCTTFGGLVACANTSKAKQIVVGPLKSMLVYEPGKTGVLDKLFPLSGATVTEFTCGGVNVAIRGGVLGSWPTINRQVHSTSLVFTQSKGVQAHKRFLNPSGTEEEIFLELSTNGGFFEQAGEEATDTITLEGTREVEIRG